MHQENKDIEAVLKFSSYGAYKGRDIHKVFSMMDKYKEYKRAYADNIKFNPNLDNLSITHFLNTFIPSLHFSCGH